VVNRRREAIGDRFHFRVPRSEFRVPFGTLGPGVRRSSCICTLWIHPVRVISKERKWKQLESCKQSALRWPLWLSCSAWPHSPTEFAQRTGAPQRTANILRSLRIRAHSESPDLSPVPPAGSLKRDVPRRFPFHRAQKRSQPYFPQPPGEQPSCLFEVSWRSIERSRSPLDDEDRQDSLT
jgi:hypothetical protein